jgi:hypothetical protein
MAPSPVAFASHINDVSVACSVCGHPRAQKVADGEVSIEVRCSIGTGSCVLALTSQQIRRGGRWREPVCGRCRVS